MQTPRPINDPGNGLVLLVAVVLGALAAGTIALHRPGWKGGGHHHPGQGEWGSRLPGLNLKIPFVQSVYPFDGAPRRPRSATLTKDLQC